MHWTRIHGWFGGALLGLMAAGAAHGQCSVAGNPCITVSSSKSSLNPGESANLQALVINATGTVDWSQSPSGDGTLPGSTPIASGLSTNTFTYPATSTLAATTTVAITATIHGTSVSYSFSIQLVVAALAVTPASVALDSGQSQQFTVNGTSSAAAWSISPQVGTITGTGLYTAPSPVTAAQRITVTVSVNGATATATVTLEVLIDVGTGAPTPTLQVEFIQAFYRNGFNNLVSVPPQGQVASLGGGVYGQKFSDAAKDSGVTYALVTASASVNPAPDGSSLPVAQIYPGIFAYYSTTGAATAGAPLSDTLNCPAFRAGGNSCTYSGLRQELRAVRLRQPVGERRARRLGQLHVLRFVDQPGRPQRAGDAHLGRGGHDGFHRDHGHRPDLHHGRDLLGYLGREQGPDVRRDRTGFRRVRGQWWAGRKPGPAHWKRGDIYGGS